MPPAPGFRSRSSGLRVRPLLLLDDLLRFLVERLALPLRLAERRHPRALAQHVDAGVDALGLLHGDAVAVARADEVLHDLRAVGIEPDRLERAAAELHRGFERLAQLIVDVAREQLQRVAAVVGARENLGAG